MVLRSFFPKMAVDFDIAEKWPLLALHMAMEILRYDFNGS